MKKQDVFTANPKLAKYYKTSDGVKFFREHDAKTHARTLKDKDVETVKRPAGSTAKDSEKKTASKAENPEGGEELTPMQKAKLRVEAIEKMATVEEVEKALEEETAKSVIKAGKARIEAINKEKE